MDQNQSSDVVVGFNASVQSIGALQAAAYRIIGDAACHIDEANGRYICQLSPLASTVHGEELRTHFLNLVNDENLREKVARETEPIRNVIVALAFGSLVGES
ncbi:hypothetical protein QWI29_17575 [Mycolicibacterium neoaurum]|uniref:hypothetical protein n=1 Tax=Mycolicibacterium neoaurum TaxID=1795 RepID=UPI002671E9AB|nr:hypothetical protein [Mycolicibacterium neoaurum]MDO3401855.1 hypothetical protein [Mycolicibacterium neoaurum]